MAQRKTTWFSEAQGAKLQRKPAGGRHEAPEDSPACVLGGGSPRPSRPRPGPRLLTHSPARAPRLQPPSASQTAMKMGT